jgi:hypothetical protein
MKGLGSVASLSSEAIKGVSAAALVGGQNTRVLAQSFREVGVSIYAVGERMKEVNDIAKNAGVSVTAVSELVVSNLKQMNLYNFDTGVKGLSQMAVTSERLGVSMNRVFDFAEKIFNPEGAIEMSAGLQRLGVTASGLLDPLRAMDLAMNDPKGLQDEILNITKEFTRFNEVNGNFEIMRGSKRRLREIAKEMGIPADELAQMSIKAADFDRKMQQITFPSLATDQETKEMIAGMAQLKDGKAMINVRNETTGEVELKSVEELTAKDIETLKKSLNPDTVDSLEETSVNTLRDMMVNLVDEKEELKARLKEIDSKLEKVMLTLGVGETFQATDGTVFRVQEPAGTFISFKRVDYLRTRKEGEKGGNYLSKKEVEELGFKLK